MPERKPPVGGSLAPTALKTTAARNAGVLASSGAKMPGIRSGTKLRSAPRPPRSSLFHGKTPGSYDSGLFYANKQLSKSLSALDIEPIAVAIGSENEDEDFEEVPIPSAADQSSPYAGTPATPGTYPSQGRTASIPTSPRTMDDEYAGYDAEQDDEEENHGQDDGIRLEIGGESPEERAKRIAFALRKWVKKRSPES